MSLGRRDIDAAPLELLAVLGEARRQPPPLGQDGIERGAELARKVNDHENGRRKIGRKFACQETQRLEASSRSADGENVAMSHGNGTRCGGVWFQNITSPG
jgi:hypothetical protein